MVQAAHLKGKRSHFSLSILSLSLYHIFYLLWKTCYQVFHSQSYSKSGAYSALKPTPANVLLRQLKETCIEQAQNHPADSRNDSNKLPKSRNLDQYYGNLHIEYYYFYQQCKNHFEVIGLLGYKCVLFAVRFLKDYILNHWQQHKTQIQYN